MDKEAEKQRITLEIQQLQQQWQQLALQIRQLQTQQTPLATEIIKRQGQLEYIEKLPDEEKKEGA